jgi:hypothetical protein
VSIDSIPRKKCSLNACINPLRDESGLLPISEFHKDKNRKDGLCNVCKHCKSRHHKTDKAKETKRRYNSGAKNKAYMVKFRQTEKNKEIQREYDKTEAGKASTTRRHKRQIELHPERVMARRKVAYYVAQGYMPAASSLECQHKGGRCTGKAEHYHHYNGYEPEHWLDVIPVCRKCHDDLDKK